MPNLKQQRQGGGVIIDIEQQSSDIIDNNNARRRRIRGTMNKENNLIDGDDEAASRDEPNVVKSNNGQSSQRRVLLPALKPSRKLLRSTTTTSAPPLSDDVTQSSSSMMTSSTTSNASLRTNSTLGSSNSSNFSTSHRRQRELPSAEKDADITLNSLGNDTYQSITTTGQARVLRYGETVDSLFCLSHDHAGDDSNVNGVDASRHRQLCQQVCQGEAADYAKAWCEAIMMTLQLNCSNETATPGRDEELVLGKRLIQLLRRATSRFKLVKRTDENGITSQQREEEGDILKIWLLYALVLVRYSDQEDDGGGSRKNDAGQTYRHIQRVRFGSGGSSSFSEDFYGSLLVITSDSGTITVDEVVRSLKETIEASNISLMDIFHIQWKQIQSNSGNNNALSTTKVTTAATSTTTATQAGGRVIALPLLKGKRSNHIDSVQREKTSVKDDNIMKIDDVEDTFDLKLKTARSKLEEGLNKKSSIKSNDSNNKRSLLKPNSKLSATRKKPRGTSGKLGAILSQSMHEDDEDEDVDDDKRNTRLREAAASNRNISPKEHILFQDNISPIEAEPTTSIKDMDLDYLLSWDPTKRGNANIVSQKKKKVTIADEADDDRGGVEDAKEPVKKITRNDLGYMLNWEPFADRQKKDDDSVDSSNSSNNSASSKAKVPPKKSALTAAKGMSTIDEGTEDSIEREEDNPIKVQPPVKTSKDDSDNVKQGLEIFRQDNDLPGDQADKSEKMIPTSQLDCSFLPLIENKNIIRVDGEPYAKLGVIGKGGSCKVYRALSTECDVVALKKVKLDGLNKQAIDGYANEIALLKRLKGNPAIIQLYSAEVDYERKSILLVMELGEVDLNYVLRQQELLSSKQKSGPGRSSLNMNFIRLTWQQMLTAVHSIHEERIIHSDLKPANFLFVRGALKLIDFGIAKAIEREDTTNVYRETLSGTLSYMSPEAIMDTTTNAKGVRVNKCGRPSDIWSLGCILYQMVYGKTPFADCHGIPQKVLAITNVNHEILFPGGVDESAIDAMKLCLQRNPKLRPPIVGKNGLLNDHYFLHGKTKSNQN